MKGRFFAFTRALFGLGLFLLITTSCEIGLGAAVDTEAPVASILAPNVKEAISGDILVSGTCSDDAKMGHMMIVELLNYETQQAVPQLTGQTLPVTNGGTEWSFSLKYCGDYKYSFNGGEPFTLMDGTYTLTMIAVDASEQKRKSGITARSFDVDNTAPVFLLTKPNSIDLDQACAFGQNVKIKGSIADDHNIANMKITLYPYADGQIGSPIELAQDTFSGFDVSDTSVTIADYAGDDYLGDDANKTEVELNYERAYDIETSGTQYFLLDITISDIAGNVTNNVYIEENIKNALNNKGISEALTGAEMKKILNGSYGTDKMSAERQAIVKSLLAGDAAENGVSKYWVSESKPLALKVNKANNPTYQVLNATLIFDDEGMLNAELWGDVNVQSPVSILVQEGADGYGVDPSSINVRIYQAPSSEMTREEYAALIAGEPLWSTEDSEETDADDDNYKKLTVDKDDGRYVRDMSDAVGSATYTLTLPTEAGQVESGQYYVLTVSGEDVNGSDLKSTSVYGFHAKGDGNAPTFEAESGAYVNYYASPFESQIPASSYLFPLTVTDALEGDNSHYKTTDGILVKWELYKGHAASLDRVSDLAKLNSGEIRGSGDDASKFGTPVLSGENTVYSYNLLLPAFTMVDGESNYTYLISVKIKNASGESMSKKYLLYVDGGKPGLSINGFADGTLILETVCQKVSGDYFYSVGGTWSETNGSGLKKLVYKKDSDATEYPVANFSTPVADTLNWTVSIPVNDSNATKYTFIATDDVGNESRMERNVRVDLGVPNLTITPVTTSSDKFNAEKVYTVTATDTYGMSDLTVTARKNGTGDYSGSHDGLLITPSSPDANTKTAAVKFTPTAADGLWDVRVVATDLNGRSLTKNFGLIMDGTKPEIQGTFTVNGYDSVYTADSAGNYFKSNTLTLTGKIKEETSGLSKVYWRKIRSNETPPTASDLTNPNTPSNGVISVTGKSSGSNYVEFPLTVTGFNDVSDGKYDVIYLTAVDEAGNASDVKHYNIKVDSSAPSLGTVGYDAGDGFKQISGTVYHKGNTMTIYGLVSDSVTGLKNLSFSGISSPAITFSTDEVTGANYSTIDWTATTANDATAIKSWKLEFTPTGSHTLTALAADNAGNPSSSLTVCKLEMDGTAPSITDLNISSGDIIYDRRLSSNNLNNGTMDLTVSGKWSDADSGTNILKYRTSDSDPWQVVTSAQKSKDVVGWTFSIAVSEGSGNKIELYVEDVAGNNAIVTLGNLTYDFSLPVITLPVGLKSVYNKEDLSESPLSKTFSISANDGYLLESTVIKATKDGTTYESSDTVPGLTITNSTTETNSQTATIKFDSPAADGTWSVSVVARDKAGQEVSKKFDVTIDGTDPEVSTTLNIDGNAYSETSYYNNTSLQFSGSVTENVEHGYVYYKLDYDNGNVTKPADLTANHDDTLPLSGSGEKSFSATSTKFQGNEAGKYNRLYIQAFDAAGNKSVVQEFKVNVDLQEANLNVKYFANGDVDPSEYSGQILSNRQKKLRIYGEVSDSDSGLNAIALRNNNSPITGNASISYTTENPADVVALKAVSSWAALSDSNRKSVKWWKVEFESSKIPDGTVYVEATDVAGNKSTASFDLVIDSQAPTLHDVNLLGNAGAGVYLKDSTYYVKKGIFTLSGVSMDNYALSSTSYTLKKGTTDVGSGSSADSSWSFSLDLSDWNDKETGQIVVTSVDAAGTSTSEAAYTYNLVVDDVSPELLTNEYKVAYQYKGEDVLKDQFFFVGGKYSESSFANATALSVSGYYKEDGSGIKSVYYLVAENQSVSTDAQGNLIAPAKTAEQVMTDAKHGIFSVATPGYEYPTYKGTEQKKYNLDGDLTPKVDASGEIETTRFEKSMYFNFKETLAGFNRIDAANKRDVLYLVAEDYCGNLSAVKTAIINVDLDPASVETDVTDVVPTNGTADFTISGTAIDTLSGIQSVEFRVGPETVGGDKSTAYIFAYDDGSAYKKDVYSTEHIKVTDYLSNSRYASHGIVRFYTGSNTGLNFEKTVDFYRNDKNKWDGSTSFFLENGPQNLRWELKITPNADWFTTDKLGQSPVVYAIIKDWADNVATYPVATLKLDTKKPTVTVTTPDKNKAVNGRVDFRGSVDEDNAPKSLKLYYWYGTGSAPTNIDGWTLFKGLTTDPDEADADDKISLVNVSELYNFGIEGFDFNQFAVTSGSDASTGSGYVILVATDMAGNTSINTTSVSLANAIKYDVDRDTDRPTISFNELTGSSGYTQKYRVNIGGIVSDDDAVAEVKISSTAIDTSEGWASVPSLISSSGASTVSFDYTPSDSSDGPKTLYIYVKDSQGGEFWTGNSVSWMQPKVKYAGSTSETSLSNVISYSFDSKAPSASVTMSVGSDKTGTFETPSGISRVGGTTRKWVVLKVNAGDENGIASVVGKFSGSETDYNFKAPDTEDGAGDWTCEIDAGTQSGQKIFNITVTDGSGFTTQRQVSFIFDNAGPKVTMITTTSLTTALDGAAEIIGTTTDEEGSGIVDLRHLVLTNEMADLSDGDLIYNFNNMSSAERTAQNQDTEHSYFNWLFKPKFPAGTTGGVADYSSFRYNGDIYKLVIAFYAKDELGNVEITKKDLYYNPFADRPSAAILFPEPADGDFDASMSGAVRISGSATDNEVVAAVYLQVAFGHSSQKKDSDGIEAMSDGLSGEGEIWDKEAFLTACPDFDRSTVFDKTNFPGVNDDLFEADPNFWGIKVTSTDNWYITLNKSREFQNSAAADPGDVGTYTIWIRAAAMDKDGLLGSWSTPLPLSLNPNAPSIGTSFAPYVQLYTDSNYATASSQIPYTPDMWISGPAKLVTCAEHINGISDISFTVSGEGGNTAALGTVNALVNNDIKNASVSPETEAGKSYWKIEIPLVTDGTGTSGERLVQVKATEGANNLHKTETYTFKFDNVAPSLADGFTLNDEIFVSGAKMQNSNLRLTVGGKVDDADSGLEKLLFYFIRDNTIYNPIVSGSEIPVAGLDSFTSGGKTLYGKNQDIVWSDEYNFTTSENDSHVRLGDAVKIGNRFYRIKNLSSSGVSLSVTIDKGIGDTAKAPTDAFFPYAQVVDNTGSESIKEWTSTSHKFRNGDDGDTMPESISKTGSTFTWEATLHGNYMKDGPIDLVAFAVDAAGNVGVSSINGSLQNNPPRLAKVFLGTDLNHDNRYSDFEFEQYDLFGVTGSYQEAYNLTTAGYKVMEGKVAVDSSRAAFVAKNTLAVYPEFTGNIAGPVKMVFTRKADTLGTHYTEENSTIVPLVQQGTGTALIAPDAVLDSNNSAIKSGVYRVENSALKGGNNNDDYELPSLLSFWDNTAGLTQGTDSQYSVIRVSDLWLNLVDDADPATEITPFYWKGQNDNSLYENSTANGHIELEEDWKTEGTPYNADATSGLTDGDPKVSGKIRIEGYATDDSMIEELYVKIDNFTLGEGLGSGSGDAAGYVKVAGYNRNETEGAIGWETAAATMDGAGWTFAVDPDDSGSYFGQSGHKVKWTLCLDTSKVSDMAQTDVVVSIMSKDIADHYVAQTYKMDIVPYITSVKTVLSKKTSKANSTEYDRTALGHYPVQVYGGVGETISINGFNIPAGKTLQIATDRASGEMSVVVKGVESINNMNNNDSHGSYDGGSDTTLHGYITTPSTIPPSGDYELYSNFYNRCPNGMNNNTLTDDVYLDVWKINNQAAVGENGKGVLRDLVMKVNPASKMLGFAFVNGSTRFSLPNGSENSNELWYGDFDTFSAVSLAFDSDGNSYGTAAGGDIAGGDSPSVAFYKFMTSRWRHPEPHNRNGSNYQNTGREVTLHANAIEKIGQKGTKGDAAKENIINKRRIKSPSLATHKYGEENGHALTNVYLAYYDEINAEVRFKWDLIKTDFDTNGSKTGDTAAPAYYAKEVTGCKQNTGYLAHIHSRGLGTDDRNKYNNDYVQLIAETLDSGDSGVTLGKAGPYVSLDVIPGNGGADTVVLVWFDGTDTQYTYSTNITSSKPSNMKGNATGCINTNFTKKVGSITTYWQPAKKIFSGAGAFCKVVADGNGGVHIAAQDSVNGNLRYAYLPSANASYNESKNSVVVDSSGIVGSQLTMDVALDGSGTNAKAVPYISYYAGSMPKIAYCPEGFNSATLSAEGSSLDAGAENNLFTGKWECSYVPTSSKVPEDRINVGLWKGNGGVIANSDSSTVSSYSTSDNTGVCYGNGTANPAVGYIRTYNASRSYVETAQKQ